MGVHLLLKSQLQGLEKQILAFWQRWTASVASKWMRYCRHRTAPGNRPGTTRRADDYRGVCVDSYLQTSNADIYALAIARKLTVRYCRSCNRFNLADGAGKKSSRQ